MYAPQAQAPQAPRVYTVDASYAACKHHADIAISAFSDEYFLCKIFPEVYHSPLSPKAAEIHAKMAKAWARAHHLKLLSGKYVLYNSPMATALYALPESRAQRLTLLQRLRCWLYSVYYSVLDILERHPMNWYIQSPESKAWFRQWEFDVEDPPGLASCSFDQLAHNRYPQKDLVWLAILAVHKNAQTSGQGSAMLKASLEHLGQSIKTTEFFEGPIGPAVGPAKVGLFPTRGNDSFYRRYGFETVLTKKLEFRGETFEHQMMQRVI